MFPIDILININPGKLKKKIIRSLGCYENNISHIGGTREKHQSRSARKEDQETIRTYRDFRVSFHSFFKTFGDI